MIRRILQKHGVCAAVLLLHASLGASKCKTFASLVAKCGLNAGCLSVNNNVIVGGNLCVGGTITTPRGGLGDFFAYGSWVNTTSGIISAGTNVTFPTAGSANSSNIMVDATNSIFTVNVAGTYLILYQVTGLINSGATSPILQQAPAATGIFTQVAGGTILMNTIDSTGDQITLEVSNAIIIIVGSGDKFQLLNSDSDIEADAGTHAGNSAAITFLRIHA